MRTGYSARRRALSRGICRHYRRYTSLASRVARLFCPLRRLNMNAVFFPIPHSGCATSTRRSTPLGATSALVPLALDLQCNQRFAFASDPRCLSKPTQCLLDCAAPIAPLGDAAAVPPIKADSLTPGKQRRDSQARADLQSEGVSCFCSGLIGKYREPILGILSNRFHTLKRLFQASVG